MLNDGIMQEDTYRVFVPIGETDDLMKSVDVDTNGDYIVQGVMTAEDKDEEDDSITPEGMDCSYFLEKGWIKYEHGNNPNQFIGEPIEVKVGQFEHPTKHTMVKGIYVKGRLFAKRDLAKQAIDAIKDLQKSHTKRKMGWSIEGNVKERDRKTGKIVKSILRNVVLTMNPVNTMTWAELSKSFAKNHELTIDMGTPEMYKSMGTEGALAITQQSIEGYTPEVQEKDEQSRWIKLFREFVKTTVLSKSLRNKFVTSTTGVVGMTAYTFAIQQKLDNEEAYQFASYIADKQEVLKSVFRANFGGELMQKSLSEILDVDLEELQKSLYAEEEEDEGEELSKSTNEEEEDEEEEDEEEEDEEEEGEEEEGEEEEGEEEEETEKSVKTNFAKSLASNTENQSAFEVSDFLANLADEVGYSIDGFAKSMALSSKNQGAIVKSLVSFGDVVKSLVEKVEDLQSSNETLQKSLNEVLNAPVGRRSVVGAKELTTIQKSLAPQGTALSRVQIGDVLMKSFEAGEINGMTVSRFEAGVSLDGLNLPQGVLSKLGL